MYRIASFLGMVFSCFTSCSLHSLEGIPRLFSGADAAPSRAVERSVCVRLVVGMTPRAIRFRDVEGRQRPAPQEIYALAHGLKMRGIDTTVVAAQVVKSESARDRTPVEFVGHAMGYPRLAIHRDSSVPIWSPHPDPQPTARHRLRLIRVFKPLAPWSIARAAPVALAPTTAVDPQLLNHAAPTFTRLMRLSTLFASSA